MPVFFASALAQTALATPPALTDAALDAIVADASRFEAARSESVHLEGDAQREARALNLVGAAGSDVGNAVNALTIESSVYGSLLQQNRLEQQETRGGFLGRATLEGMNVTRESRAESRFESVDSSSLYSAHSLQSHVRTSTVDQFAVFVPSRNPLQDLTLDVGTPQLSPIRINPIGFDFRDSSGSFGIAGSAGPFTLGAPQVVLGTVSLDGDDVVLSSGYVQLPSLDLGSATLLVCFAACASESVDLGSFGGRRLDLPGGDLRFEDANPFRDTQINVGGGVAIVGAGTLDVRPSHLTVSAELTLDLPDPTFSFDFTIGDRTDGEDVIGPWTIDGPDITVEIPTVTVSHTLIDEDIGGAFSGTFDGFLCIPQGMTCGTGSRRTQRHEAHVDERVQVASSSTRATGGAVATVAEEVRAGASLREAEAELIAMSQASARIDAKSAITLTDAAQEGMRVGNAVNAADTIVGNALNVTSLRPSSLATGSVATSLGQSNVFVQQRTGYGR